MSNEIPYKRRLYDTYISSGHVIDTGENADVFLRPNKAYILHIIAEHMPSNRKVRIVDLGCGHGTFLYFLLRAGYTDVTGVDASHEQITVAHRLGILQARQGDIGSFLRNTTSLSVDVVLLMDVLEHFTREDLFIALDEVFRVLRPGGRCIAHVPNAEGLFGMRIRYGDLTHEMAFTSKSVRQVLRSIGFADVACFEDKPVVHGLKSFVRRVLWDIGTLPFRVLLGVESACARPILSQNMLVMACK